MDAELSSDDEVLDRIEPLRNRKYNLATYQPVPLEPGLFERGHIPINDEIRDKCEEQAPIWLNRDNTQQDDLDIKYLETQIQPVMKELIPYVLSKLSDDPKTHLLEKVRDMRKKKVLLALGKRQLELEAKLSEQQNPDEPYID